MIYKSFPPELLTINQKALQKFMSRLDGYTYDNCKKYETGNVVQKAVAYYSPYMINVDCIGIDLLGKISNFTYQLKITKTLKDKGIKGFRIKNKQGKGNESLIFADYYIFLEQSTGRGVCVDKSCITNIRQQNSDTIADVSFKPEDFWMQSYDIKNEHLNPNGDIIVSDDYWKAQDQFHIQQFELCL